MVFEETTEVYEHMDHMAMPKLPAEIAESNSLAVFNSKLLPHIAKNYLIFFLSYFFFYIIIHLFLYMHYLSLFVNIIRALYIFYDRFF